MRSQSGRNGTIGFRECEEDQLQSGSQHMARIFLMFHFLQSGAFSKYSVAEVTGEPAEFCHSREWVVLVCLSTTCWLHSIDRTHSPRPRLRSYDLDGLTRPTYLHNSRNETCRYANRFEAGWPGAQRRNVDNVSGGEKWEEGGAVEGGG